MTDKRLFLIVLLVACVVMAGVYLGVTPEQIERAAQVVSGILGDG